MIVIAGEELAAPVYIIYQVVSNAIQSLPLLSFCFKKDFFTCQIKREAHIIQLLWDFLCAPQLANLGKSSYFNIKVEYKHWINSIASMTYKNQTRVCYHLSQQTMKKFDVSSMMFYLYIK